MSREATAFQAFGEVLRAARQAQHRSIDEVAQRTRINRRFLEAIESGDLAQLPPGPYTRAFLREYARAVGCTVPQELAHIANTPNPIALGTSLLPQVSRRDRTGSGPSRTTSEHPDSSGKPGTGAAEQFGAALRATKELPKKANQAAKSAARTTEKVIKRVETGAKEAVDVFTSKSLWNEAEQVRRERRGLQPTHESESGTAVRVSNDAGFNIRDIRENANDRDSSEKVDDDSAVGFSHATSKPSRTGVFSTTNLVIMSAVLLFAGVMAFALRMNKEDKSPADATEETATVSKEAPAKAKIAVVEPKPAAPNVTQPGVDSLRFIVRAKSPVWVSIGPDGKTPFTAELKSGETRSFAAGEKFLVNLGDQNALEMTFNGQALSHLPTIPKSGIVVRDLVLTRDHVTLGGRPITMNGAAATNTTVAPKATLSSATPAKRILKSTSTPSKAAHVITPDTKIASTAHGTKPPVKSTSKVTKPAPHKKQVKKIIPPVEPLPALP